VVGMIAAFQLNWNSCVKNFF